MEPEVHDYGSSSFPSFDKCWEDFEKKHIKGTTGWILVVAMSEDMCFSLFRGTEKELKKQYLSLQEEINPEYAGIYVYCNGKPVRVKETIEFVGIEEPMEEMS